MNTVNNEKTYAVAGYSVCKGIFKMRLAKDFDRIKTLIRTGHTEIEMFELPQAMTKLDAHLWLEVNHPRANVGAKVGAVEKAFEVTDALAASWKDYYPTFNTVVEEEQPTFEIKEATNRLTFEEALAQVPMREKGRFIKRDVREQMARDLMAAMA
jgi:hypothetical protein